METDCPLRHSHSRIVRPQGSLAGWSQTCHRDTAKLVSIRRMRASPKGNDPHQQSCLRIVVRAKRGFRQVQLAESAGPCNLLKTGLERTCNGMLPLAAFPKNY